MENDKITIMMNHGHPQMEIKFNEDTAFAADLENNADTPHDSAYLSVKVDGKQFKQDIACLKTTEDPNVIRLCVFVNMDPDNPDKTIHEDPVHEVYLNIDEIKENID